MSINVKSRMQKAAYLLLEGHSSKEVAVMLKARPETISRWKQHPVYIAEYERLRTEICEDMRVKLWRVAVGAFDNTCDNMFAGSDAKYRYEAALKFFKTIKIEQIFSPHTAPVAPEYASNGVDRGVNEQKTPTAEQEKSLTRRLAELSDEVLEVTRDI